MKLNCFLIIGCVCLAAPFLIPHGAAYDKDNPLDLTKEQVAQLQAKTKAGDFGACLTLSDYYILVTNEPKTAAHWWQVLVSLGDVEAIAEVGNCLIYAGEFEAAEKWLRRAKENGDEVADEYLKTLAEKRAAAGLAGKKKPEPAADHALASEPDNPAEAGGPTDASGYNARAGALIKKDNFPAAIFAADRAIELDPKNAKAYYLRGEAKEYEGNLDAAIADYTRVIELDPKNAAAYSSRGFAKGTNGDNDGLYADANRAVELDPKSANAWCFRGIARAHKNDREGAIADYTRAIELDPEYSAAYDDRGVTRARQGDREGALADCTRAIALNPKYGDYYNDRGLVETLMRNWTGALADYRKTCEISLSDPQRDYPRLFIWLIRARLGETEAANRELSASLENLAGAQAGDWVSKVGAFLVGKLDETALFAAADAPGAGNVRGQRCEAWYYAGMKKLLAGENSSAADDFRKCLETDQKDMTEYQFAEAELKALQP